MYCSLHRLSETPIHSSIEGINNLFLRLFNPLTSRSSPCRVCQSSGSYCIVTLPQSWPSSTLKGWLKPNVKFSVKPKPVFILWDTMKCLEEVFLVTYMNNKLSTVLPTCCVSDIREASLRRFFQQNGVPEFFLTLTFQILHKLTSSHLTLSLPSVLTTLYSGPSGQTLLFADLIIFLTTCCSLILKSPFSVVFPRTNIYGRLKNTIKQLRLDDL